MEIAEPKVFLVGGTELYYDNLMDYLQEIGDPDWEHNINEEGGQLLVEAAGRMCYRSWQPYDPEMPRATNPNVSKVREGNKEYLANILAHKHGAILEHVSLNFIATDVSRVFTHEIVRHRAGAAYSQESLRYVRLDDLRFWIPKSMEAHTELYKQCVETAEKWQKLFAEATKIEEMSDFSQKKAFTSAFRRVAPIGLSTSIMMTYNVRALRHIIELRTSPHAEEEARVVVGQMAKLCKEKFPNFFQDMITHEDGTCEFKNQKV